VSSEIYHRTTFLGYLKETLLEILLFRALYCHCEERSDEAISVLFALSAGIASLRSQ
jgi:hypothetical protein